MTPASFATKEDLVGSVTADAYLSADDVVVALAWGDDEIDRILARASEAIDNLIGRAVFTLGDDGLPSDPNVAAACRMATCALVAQWMEVGESNDIDGLAGSQISVTGYSGPRAPVAGPRVWRPLRRAGLLGQPSVGWDVT